MAPSTLASLLARTEIDDHEEILKAANTALKGSTNNEEAQRAKLISLLKLERYEDALESLKKGSPQLQQSCRFEKAYALYKAGNLEEARQIAREIEDHRGARHVEAQAVCPVEFKICTLLFGACTNKSRHIDLRDSKRHLLSTGSSQLVISPPKPKKATCESILEQFTLSFNGSSRKQRCPVSPLERTWRPLRLLSMLLVDP